MKLLNKLYYLVLALAVVFTLNNCSTDQISPQEEEGISITKDAVDENLRGNGNPVIHHVSVGGNDALGPGEDKSFSLVANMKADGSVSGQWVDGFGDGLGGIHVSVDCLVVDDNKAVLSGVITQVKEGTPDAYVLGERASTAVVDNGTSNNDPPDQISFSFTGEFCDFPAEAFPLSDLIRGQVKVKSK